MHCLSGRGRVQLRQDFPGDAALVLNKLWLNDTGRYRCTVVDGLEDQSAVVHLELQGTAFTPSAILFASVNESCNM